MTKVRYLAVVAATLLLGACGGSADAPDPTTTLPPPQPRIICVESLPCDVQVPETVQNPAPPPSNLPGPARR